jgi:hypothetical protein
VLVVAHRERRTRWGAGAGDSALWRAHAGRPVDAVSPTETGADRADDGVAVRPSRAARIDRRRHATRRAAPSPAQSPAGVTPCREHAQQP